MKKKVRVKKHPITRVSKKSLYPRRLHNVLEVSTSGGGGRGERLMTSTQFTTTEGQTVFPLLGDVDDAAEVLMHINTYHSYAKNDAFTVTGNIVTWDWVEAMGGFDMKVGWYVVIYYYEKE